MTEMKMPDEPPQTPETDALVREQSAFPMRSLTKVIELFVMKCHQLEADRDRLASECAALRKDAERYRWLRWASSTGKITRAQEIMFARYYSEEDIDAAIDAARSEA